MTRSAMGRMLCEKEGYNHLDGQTSGYIFSRFINYDNPELLSALKGKTGFKKGEKGLTAMQVAIVSKYIDWHPGTYRRTIEQYFIKKLKKL